MQGLNIRIGKGIEVIRTQANTFLGTCRLIFRWRWCAVSSVICGALAVLFEVLCFTALVLLIQGLSDEAMVLGLPGEATLRHVMSKTTLAGRVQLVALAFAGFSILRAIFLTLNISLGAILEQNSRFFLSLASVQKALRLSYESFHRRTVGEISNYIGDGSIVAASGVGAVLRMIQVVVLVTIYIICLLVLSPILTLAAAAILVTIYVAVQLGMASSLKRIGEDYVRVSAQLYGSVLEMLVGIRTIKLFARVDDCDSRFRKLFRSQRRVQVRFQIISAGVAPAISGLVACTIAVLLVLGCFLAGDGIDEYVGTLALFVMVLTRLAGPFQLLMQEYAAYRRSVPSLAIVEAFLAEIEGQEEYSEGAVWFGWLKDGIVFDDVSFSYEGHSKPSISSLSFTLNRGTMTALVGPSGAGKSTIVNLLARLLAPTSGTIRVDSLDLGAIDTTSWRRRIGFVSQECFLFNDTVANNLRFAKPDATDEEIERAAVAAHAHEFIMHLENGYDTMVGNNGVRLSGGQQQRLAIARAILNEPEILILDEATSHLDSISETVIQDAIRDFKGRCTLLVVAHRLSTIQAADQIIVLDNGRISEIGNHEDLLEGAGLYRRLCAVQAQL